MVRFLELDPFGGGVLAVVPVGELLDAHVAGFGYFTLGETMVPRLCRYISYLFTLIRDGLRQKDYTCDLETS